jgi:hypothetical protein
MNFKNLLIYLDKLASDELLSFPGKSHAVARKLDTLSNAECCDLAYNIHVIPEKYGHDSSEEKLYAKASDALVTAIFRHFGLTTRVLDERGDAADVIGQSSHHNYSFVADSKVFRLSRTAKNQKDFKVSSMAQWKGDNDYATVVCPLYQYPSTSSAIFAQSLNYNVALLSFEHLIFLQNHNAVESKNKNFSKLFNYPSLVSNRITHSERKKAAPLMSALNEIVCDLAETTIDVWESFKEEFKAHLSTRAKEERAYWEGQKSRFKKMSRSEAIAELILMAKIESKIDLISSYIDNNDSYSGDVGFIAEGDD